MPLVPLWKPTTHTLRPFVPAMVVKVKSESPVQLTKARVLEPDAAVAGASSRTDSVLPMPTVSSVPLPAMPLLLPVELPVQFVEGYVSAVMGAVYGVGVTPTFTLPSVNVHVARDPDDEVAVTVYCATNQSGRLNESEIVPSASAVTSTSRLQLLPKSSLTRMWTVSPGCQWPPERTTSSPGA
jgi:hypothetical protein